MARLPLLDRRKYENGIHYDARFLPGNGGRCYVKTPTGGPKYGVLTDFFTFTGDNKSMYRNASGLLVSSATNTPRIEYDASGNLLGLLVEGARTNLCLQSQTLNVDGAGVPWTNSGNTVSANATTAPDGTATADKLVEDGNNSTHAIFQTFTKAASALTYTYSIWVKAAGRGFAQMRIADATNSANRVLVNVDLTTGAVSGVAAAGTFSAASATTATYSNGWFRIALTGTSSTETSINVLLFIASASGTITYQGDSSSGIYGWGAQFEASSSFPSSYIPTTTGSVARASDLPSRVFGSEVSQSAGTVLIESTPYASGQVTEAWVTIGDGTTNERHTLIRSNNLQPEYTVHDGGVAQADLASAGLTHAAGATKKTAFAYALNDFVNVHNGTVANTDASGTLPTTTTMYLGNLNGASNFAFGHIRRLDYWPERKSDAFLRRITT